MIKVQCWRNKLMAQGQQCEYRLNATRRTQQMAGGGELEALEHELHR